MPQFSIRRAVLTILCVLPFLAARAPATHAQDKIAPAAQRAALEAGSVRVIIVTRADAEVRDGGNAFRRPATYLARQLDMPVRQLKPIGNLPMVAATVTPATLERLREDPNVAQVFRDELRHVALTETTGSTGAVNHLQAGFTGKGQVVAVLDSGVDSRHPAFKDAIVAEACFSTTYSGQEGNSRSLCTDGAPKLTGRGAGVNCDMAFSDLCSHGTHVAGIIAGRPVKLKNGKTVTGMAPGAKLMVAQVFSGFEDESFCGGAPRCISAWDSDILQALEWVYGLRNEFRIAAVNLSLGGGQFHEACDAQAAYAATIEKLRKAGIATVVASGNEGYHDAVGMPACVSSAISVSATTKDGPLDERYANIAKFVTLAAPGTEIFSAVPGRKYERMTGTSMAAPHVAGAIALIREETPEITVAGLVKLLRRTGRTVTDSRTGTRLRRMDLARIEPGGKDPVASAMAMPMSVEDVAYETQSRLATYGAETMRTVIIRSDLTADQLKAKLGAACHDDAGCTVEKIGDGSYRVTVPFALVERLTGEGSLEQKLENALGSGVRVFQNRLNRPLVDMMPGKAEEAE